MAFAHARGVLDVMWSAALKARVQATLVANAQKSTDPRLRKLLPELLAQQRVADYYAPLWKTEALTGDTLNDQYMQMISNYRDAHPEQWNKQAHDLIELALRDAFAGKVQ